MGPGPRGGGGAAYIHLSQLSCIMRVCWAWAWLGHDIGYAGADVEGLSNTNTNTNTHTHTHTEGGRLFPSFLLNDTPLIILYGNSYIDPYFLFTFYFLGGNEKRKKQEKKEKKKMRNNSRLKKFLF